MVLIVPVNMEIGGNLVENWCQIYEKKNRYLPAPGVSFSDKKRELRGMVNKQSFQA